MQRARHILFVFLLSPFLMNGQPSSGPPVQHISQTDGLVNNAVYSIAQDKRGFIWIGSDNGLQRYDGERFITYSNRFYRDAAGLIAVDNENRIFFSMGGYLKKIDLLTNQISYLTKSDLIQSPFYLKEASLDIAGEKWIVGNQYLYICRGDSSIVACDMALDKNKQHIWFVSSGLKMLDLQSKKVYSASYNPTQEFLLQYMKGKNVNLVFVDSRQNLWISTWDGEFYRYNLLSQRLTTYTIANIVNRKKIQRAGSIMVVHNVYEDNHHTIWLATSYAGVLQYNRSQDNFISVTADDENKYDVQYNFEVFNIFQDRNENIWVGTDRGISIFNPYHTSLKIVNEEKYEKLFSAEITKLIETSTGDIWVGKWGSGITVFTNNFRFKRNIEFSHPLEKNQVWSLLQDDEGKIWAGCQHGFLHWFSKEGHLISTMQPAVFAGSTVRVMQKDKEGTIIFGLHNGKIVVWNKQQNKFYPYADSSIKPNGYFAPIESVYLDKAARCWVATYKGLKEFNTKKRVFYEGVFSPGNISGWCKSIEEYNDSTLLVGYLNQGLFLFNKHTRKFTPAFNFDSTLTTSVHTIKTDTDNSVWFTTDYSVNNLNLTTGHYTTFNVPPGSINSIFSGGFYVLKDGRYVTNTTTEILSFYPEQLKKTNISQLFVTITGLKIFDNYLFADSFINKKEPLRLSYKQNFLTIEFSALTFLGGKQIRYSYRLSGIDPTWVEAGNKTSAQYTNLPPGRYTFTVKVNAGDKNEPVTSIQIIIAPPFWRTWWFAITIAIALALTAFFLVRGRIKNIRAKGALKEKIAETEMMALQAQMNPHFIFNCLNAIDNLVQTNQKDKATIYLVRFAKLIRSILDSAKHREVPFQTDLESLKLYLQMEQFRSSNRFTYEFAVDDELLYNDFPVPPLLVQPFIENAITHGLMHKMEDDRNLKIDIKLLQDEIVYTITDNGIGRKNSTVINKRNKPEHISCGIEIATRRIRLHNHRNDASDIQIIDLEENGVSTGTYVKIKVVQSENI